MSQTTAPAPRVYPDGWDLGLFTDTDADGVPYVGFVRVETATAAAIEAEYQTGALMEVIALSPRGYGYRPAPAEAAA